MAITLEDLLSKNSAESSVDGASNGRPTFEDFKASREMPRGDFALRDQAAPMRDRVVENYDRAPQYNVAPTPIARPDFSRQTEQYREYNNNNYGMGGYGLLDNNGRLTSQNAIPEQGQAYFDPSAQAARPMAYDYTVADAANATANANADDLYQRLSTTGSAPVNDETNMYYEAAQRNREEQQRQQRRLNTKGKIIIGLYAAVVAVVVALIIANAAKINKGEAVTPTSNIEIVQEDVEL